MTNKAPKAFLINFSSLDILTDFTDEEFGKILRVAIGCMRGKMIFEAVDLTPMERIGCRLLLSDAAAQEDKYQSRCRKNAAAAAKRWGKATDYDERDYKPGELEAQIYDTLGEME